MWETPLLLFCFLLSILPPALAQCNNATTTLRNIADVVAIATCTTYTGDIVVATDVAGISALLGVEEVIGSVIVANNSALTTISSDSLRSVSNDVILDTLPLLTNISLPMWSSVNTIVLNKIPAPNVINMQTTVQKVTNLYITDTTLETLFGLLLQTSRNITQQATITNNSAQMTLTLPNLIYAYNMEITNASAIEMPVLQSINQNLDISYSAVQNLTLPVLSYVGGDLDVKDNSQLIGIEMPDLVNVQGNVEISGSPQLESLSGLSALSFIGKDLTLAGEFNDAHLLSLTAVGGNLSLTSTDDTAPCADLPKSLPKGTYTCSSTAAGGQHKRTPLSKGAIAGLALAAGFLTIALTAAVVWWLLRRRHAGVREIPDTTSTTVGGATDRPALAPLSKDKRSSYGYHDLKSIENVVDAGRFPGQLGQDVAMRDLGRKDGEVERGEVYEMPTETNRERREMSASPTGAAVEMPSPSEGVGGRVGEGR
ncbi:cell wall protein Ecm33 [Friedmanniomyces endolithicus]|uniref:Cell wall protein Ecm33 n=1 Tax=Friedmanniomyces endolithicus TaxID=329885 RepID=A0AAN6KV21_9PEZI|nr:cell wall protein Ecm33 [Friedmanniomyces endolithicus]KAK0814641.1 cell wall protein Ecm33 [Friedmanniomyces endolithicus]KAK0925091.1 cell wall protein Ecm33 [Friedmanniomyces endolithicus]KAK1004788.1 cell wall protein Ecm33 [Friedmanniomyces endolithicus]